MSKDHKTKDGKSKRRESKGKSDSKKGRNSSRAEAPTITEQDSPQKPAGSSSISTTSSDVSSAFETIYPVLNLPIPPVWSSDPYAAFSDLMDTLVMRYVPQLSGVLITHTPTRFLQDTAVFNADSAFATAAVGFECVVWRPKIGQVLEGTICLSSPSHVSLLLYGLFNASIPASHLPEKDWEFVTSEPDAPESSTDQGLGHWRRRSDGAKLGGVDGKLSFTVISLTVANHMLSLHGSLLEDPLNQPAPTFDRSYLRKSLLPSQALGLGLRSGASVEDVQPDTRTSSPRRVRWQDEDDSSSDTDADDSQKLTSTTKSIPSIESIRESSKRKPKTDSDAAESKTADLDSPKREKKRRKEG